jgi:selenocysteine-specific elongation factor
MTYCLNNSISAAPFVCVSTGSPATQTENVCKSMDIDKLYDAIRDSIYIRERKSDAPFVMAVDHCFAIKGQGTVMTGLLGFI